MSIGVKYLSAAKNPSGYGQAARNFIASLYLSQINVTTETISQMVETADYSWLGKLVETLEDRKIDYQIKIHHVTPDLYPRYIEKAKYNIGHLFFETDRLPKEWVGPCNKMNEIWTLSESQAKMIEKSGVTVPIYCFPQPVDTSWADSNIAPYILPNFEGFIFFSIFQWIERKNPKALLTSYWKAFEGKRDVALILKTYRVNYSEAEFKRIQAEVDQWKKELNLTHYPKVHLVNRLLTTPEMFRLHKTGDVFISTSRGEGFCIPAVEASLMGKPVVSIDRTGFADLFPKDIYYPISCRPSRVKQVHSIPWYTVDQNWLDIDQEQLINTLKDIYNDRQDASNRGEKAKQFVKNSFNYFIVGDMMKKRLEAISQFL